MQSLKKILRNYQNDPTKYISREFQDYGYRLAVELDDLKHKSLYIKLAKTLPRALLEQARTFVQDAQARSKARLFMWKVSQLNSPSTLVSKTRVEFED
jgi:hypothetical protein